MNLTDDERARLEELQAKQTADTLNEQERIELDELTQREQPETNEPKNPR